MYNLNKNDNSYSYLFLSTKTEQMDECHLQYFLGSKCKKKKHLFIYPEIMSRNGEMFLEESLRRGRVVKNIESF